MKSIRFVAVLFLVMLLPMAALAVPQAQVETGALPRTNGPLDLKRIPNGGSPKGWVLESTAKQTRDHMPIHAPTEISSLRGIENSLYWARLLSL